MASVACSVCTGPMRAMFYTSYCPACAGEPGKTTDKIGYVSSFVEWNTPTLTGLVPVFRTVAECIAHVATVVQRGGTQARWILRVEAVPSSAAPSRRFEYTAPGQTENVVRFMVRVSDPTCAEAVPVANAATLVNGVWKES